MNHCVLSLAAAGALASALALPACATGSPASPSMGEAGAEEAAEGGGGEDGGTPESSITPMDARAGTPVSVTFSYAPGWSGVTKVEVVGGFGLASDWSKTDSLVTLSASGPTYSGTAMLPPGTYPYLFRVTGDAEAAKPAALVRYAVDPLQTAYAECPPQSPTYSTIDHNPCSQIMVTLSGGPAAASPVHVKGAITVNGAAAKGWMVVLERNEPQSHHFFANRITAGTDGGFDLIGSKGAYRLQVWHPTLLSQNDLERDPTQLLALRRAISDSIPLASSDVTVAAPDLAFHAYGRYAPTVDAGGLPTEFTFESGSEAKLTIYGGPGDGGVVDIGDPWYASALTTDGGAGFGGIFNTPQSTQDAAVPGVRYLWGTEAPFDADASVTWTKQTMVFPVTWH
jgi:hypothetical protein